MKLLLLLFVSLQGLGQVYYSVELGLLDRQMSLSSTNQYCYYEDKLPFYTDIKLGYSYKHIYIETNVANIFYKSKSVYFKPRSTRYDFRLYYEYKKRFQIGYEHSCTHPVLTGIRELPTSLHGASHDKIFIKYTLPRPR